MVHSTTRNAHYLHPSNGSIMGLWRTFPNEGITVTDMHTESMQLIIKTWVLVGATATCMRVVLCSCTDQGTSEGEMAAGLRQF